MFVATCVITLQLNGVASLKDKRQIVKSILARTGRQFNVAVAEVDHHDVWQTAVIALAAIGNDKAHLHSQMEHAVTWIANSRPDIPIDDYAIELW